MYKMMSIWVVIVLSCFGIFDVEGQVLPGEPCTLTHNGETGTCKRIATCPKVVEDYKKQRVNPTLCGWDGFQQVVCCPAAAPVTTKTTTKATTKAPTTTKAAATVKPTKVYTTKSGQNCARYSEFVYEYIKFAALVEGEESNKRKVDRCGHKKVALVVGGTAAGEKEFPHMALIGYGDLETREWLCGGSLIAENYVLSAGHCANGRAGPARFIRVGEANKNDDADNKYVQDFEIIKNIPHPAYRSSSQYNDVALFQLDRNAKLNPWVRPLCLPESATIKEKKAIASGWGRIGWTDDTSDGLLKVTLDFFPQDECHESYGTTRKLADGIKEDQQVCAGSRSDDKDTCEGDSGGPLQVFHPDHHCMYTIVGVTSFGKGCGLAGQPAVYARIHHFVPWIESVVWP